MLEIKLLMRLKKPRTQSAMAERLFTAVPIDRQFPLSMDPCFPCRRL